MHTVRVNIRRRDLAWLNLELLPRLRSTWISWLVIAVLIVGVLIYRDGLPETVRSVAVLLLAAVIGATVGIVAGAVLTLLGIATASAECGTLGEHTFTIRDDGLQESTAVNESVSKWAGIRSACRTRSYIYIEIAPGLFHVLPRRNFESTAAYNEFWGELNMRRTQSS